MASSNIEWTDETWNPVTGCDKVSPGCAHCYAETVALRFCGKQYPQIKYTDEAGSTDTRDRRFTDVMCHEDRLHQPLRWKKPRKVFVNSMSDLFHEDVPNSFIDRVFAVMALSPRHTFQVLTKRAERMRDYVTAEDRRYEIELAMYERGGDEDARTIAVCPIPNVWLGVSVENQHFADERIPLLLQTPAAVRFVSYEPALGPIDFSPWLEGSEEHGTPFSGAPTVGGCIGWTPALDWVIAGGESGRDARPSDLSWYLKVHAQCAAAGVAFFMKQLGRNPYVGDGGGPDILTRSRPGLPSVHFYELDIDKGHGGNMAEWPKDLRVREYPV